MNDGAFTRAVDGMETTVQGLSNTSRQRLVFTVGEGAALAYLDLANARSVAHHVVAGLEKQANNDACFSYLSARALKKATKWSR